MEHRDRFVSCVADALRVYIHELHELRNRTQEESGKRELAEMRVKDLEGEVARLRS